MVARLLAISAVYMLPVHIVDEGHGSPPRQYLRNIDHKRVFEELPVTQQSCPVRGAVRYSGSGSSGRGSSRISSCSHLRRRSQPPVRVTITKLRHSAKLVVVRANAR
eukprot:SAG22_NODE_255_length_13562_cov_6.101463_12_plen_107_part_00